MALKDLKSQLLALSPTEKAEAIQILQQSDHLGIIVCTDDPNRE